MHDVTVMITVVSFLLTVGYIFWRPHVNEAIPAAVGAVLVLLSGSVTLQDLSHIASTTGGAAITIMATIVMAIVLESFGFFYWSAELLTRKANGSGYRLFWLTCLFCFLMTLFVNNDGSILITTPILLMLLRNMRLKPHQKIPYLLSGALVATASSAPIGVSNIVNLIALKIVDMDLYLNAAMMFVPSTIGLLAMTGMLFAVFHPVLPRRLPIQGTWDIRPGSHPLQERPVSPNRNRMMRNILLFVIGVRISLFAASYLQLSIPLTAVAGSMLLLGWRWYRLRIPPVDMLKKTPWHIFIFALGMYIIIYGLHNIGLTDWLIAVMRPIVSGSLLYAGVMTGVLLTVLSNLFNNHPALMIGTLALTNLDLDPLALKLSYLSGVIGSDIGALLLPIGTLATLMWMHIVRKGGVRITWGQYLSVSAVVIPVTLIVTLLLLACWVIWLF